MTTGSNKPKKSRKALISQVENFNFAFSAIPYILSKSSIFEDALSNILFFSDKNSKKNSQKCSVGIKIS